MSVHVRFHDVRPIKARVEWHNGAVNCIELALADRRPLLVDGAMGTELFALGLDAGAPPELWNVDEVDRLVSVHERYIAAGSDIILTNTFGGNGFRLMLHELQDRVVELNAAGARAARRAADAVDRKVLVAGSMGPTGELLVPMGSMTTSTCADAYADQAQGLTEGGADLLWIETMSDLAEVEAAIEGARTTSPLPIVACLSFDTAGRSMMGVTARQAVEHLEKLGVAAVGANCGNNLADTEAALAEMLTVDTDLPLVCKANAGIPEWKGDALSYSGSPDVMAAHTHRLQQAGVSLIGACCGSGPDHLALMRGVLDGTHPVPDVALPVAPERGETGEPRRSRRRRG